MAFSVSTSWNVFDKVWINVQYNMCQISGYSYISFETWIKMTFWGDTYLDRGTNAVFEAYSPHSFLVLIHPIMPPRTLICPNWCPFVRGDILSQIWSLHSTGHISRSRVHNFVLQHSQQVDSLIKQAASFTHISHFIFVVTSAKEVIGEVKRSSHSQL